MKTFYKMIFFFVMFQMAALIVAGVDVFPEGTTLYSDVDLQELEDNSNNPSDIIGYIFLPSGKIGSFELSGFSVLGIIGCIVIIGSAVSIATHSYIPAVLAILGLSFVPMVTNSITFFNKLFTQWNTTSMIYIGVTLGAGVLLLFVVMVLESVTHGRS